MNSVKVAAPAKVNLFLGIGEKQADGYHSATSLMHALGIHDVLEFTAYSDGMPSTLIPVVEQNARFVEEDGIEISIRTEWHESLDELDLAPEDNLAAQAVLLLARACEVPWKGRIHIDLEKHIPVQAGLGGGSSDAAAALVGAASLWGVDDPELLQRVARELGADVPFFLKGGCVLLEGRGDEPVRTLDPRRDNVVLVKVPGGISTEEAYAAFDAAPAPVPDNARAALDTAQQAADVVLFNNLAPAAEGLLPELAEIREWLVDQPGVTDVLLCGSGAATFAVCEDHQAALALVGAAREKGCWSRATSFSRLRAAKIPER